MAPDADPRTPNANDEKIGDRVPAERRRRRSPLGLAARVLAGVAIAASFSIWIYAFSGAADRDPPDLLEDEAFPLAAEQVCAAAVVDLEAMPNALDAVDGPDRANQIRNTTVRLELMLDDLEPLVTGTARDVEITTGWLSDWRVMIQDRYRYADAIAVDDQAQFLVTDVGVSERLDKRLTRVANTNAMPSCAVPGDVG